MTTRMWVVSVGTYRMGIEITGSQPDAAYFHGWLQGFVTHAKMASVALEDAERIATAVQERWPGRAFFVEVSRGDRYGAARIESFPVREVRH